MIPLLCYRRRLSDLVDGRLLRVAYVFINAQTFFGWVHKSGCDCCHFAIVQDRRRRGLASVATSSTSRLAPALGLARGARTAVQGRSA